MHHLINTNQNRHVSKIASPDHYASTLYSPCKEGNWQIITCYKFIVISTRRLLMIIDERWSTVEMIIQTSIFHEIIEEEVANWRHWVAAQADEVSVLDASQYSQLGLKLVDILWEVIVQLLDCYGMAIFEATLIDSTWTSSSDNVLLTQVFCQVHHLFIRLRRHTKMEDHKTWWACSTIMYIGQVSQ